MIKDLIVNDGTLVIPPELGSIPDSSCAGREDIRQIVFPPTIYSIAPEAFAECTALEEVKLRSRQYAKRQLTWLRRNDDIHWIFWKKERDFARALQLSTEILTAEGVF